MLQVAGVASWPFHRVWDIQRRIMAGLWNLGYRGPFNVIENYTIRWITTSCQSVIATIALSCTIFEIFDVEDWLVDLIHVSTASSGIPTCTVVHYWLSISTSSDDLERSYATSYWSSIVIVWLSSVVSEIYRFIGRKSAGFCRFCLPTLV